VSDIVERLRGSAEDAEPDDAGWSAVMLDAATEIEWLRGDRAQLVLMTELLRASNQEIERLRKEVEQWRENDKAQRDILAGAIP